MSENKNISNNKLAIALLFLGPVVVGACGVLGGNLGASFDPIVGGTYGAGLGGGASGCIVGMIMAWLVRNEHSSYYIKENLVGFGVCVGIGVFSYGCGILGSKLEPNIGGATGIQCGSGMAGLIVALIATLVQRGRKSNSVIQGNGNAISNTGGGHITAALVLFLTLVCMLQTLVIMASFVSIFMLVDTLKHHVESKFNFLAALVGLIGGVLWYAGTAWVISRLPFKCKVCSGNRFFSGWWVGSYKYTCNSCGDAVIVGPSS